MIESAISELGARESIISACLEMNKLGINQGTSGNISVRHKDKILITPTSIPYEELEPEDVVSLSMNGEPYGHRAPSTEWRFHCDIMNARPDVNAIVHAHPMYATTIAIMERDIPPIHYMIAVAGGDNIRCAPYATFGTKELSHHAVEALKDRQACLLAHHGIIAVGRKLSKAMWLAVEVETLAHQYHGCLQIGEPPQLTSDQINDVVSKMTQVGYRDQH